MDENLVWLVSLCTNLSVSFAISHPSLHLIFLSIYSLDPPESPDTWFSVSQNHRPEKPPKMPSASGYPQVIP